MPGRDSPRILVVDDHPEVRAALCSLLRRRGYQVTPAADGLEAAGHLALGPFDLVVTDYQMPRLNGAELWRHACEQHPHLRDRFLICTATPGWVPPELAHRVLPKPVGGVELWAAVEDLLGRPPPA